MKNKTILITGASSGIGKATAHLFAKNENNIILTGRREDRLNAISTDLRSKYGIKATPLCFDIRNNNEVISAYNSLEKDWQSVDILINNAGLAAGLDEFQDSSTDDWEQMIDTNIKGLLYMSKIVSKDMVENKNGHIINISSIAASNVYQKGHVYCGTKHAVDAISKGMRIDLMPHNVRVSSVSPGLVETEFSLVRFKWERESAENVYKGYQPLKAEDIAESVYFVADRPPHVNINDLLIMPTAQANAYYLNKDL